MPRLLAEGLNSYCRKKPYASESTSGVIFLFCLMLLAAGGAFLIYVFLLPHDFITDETEYLTEVVSMARGVPQGWDLRSVVYPALVAPLVWLVEALSDRDPSAAIVAARSANLAIAFVAAATAYALGRQLAGRLCGLAAAVFTLFSWAWAWSATRFMMDVPAGTWLALTVLLLVRRDPSPSHSAMIVIFGGLAVLTKFQMAPAVLAAGLWHLAQQPSWPLRGRAGLNMVCASAGMVGLYCLSEYLAHGHPFGSLLAFYRYNIGEIEAFVETYGACEPAIFYLQVMPNVFSYLLPPLAILGVGFGLIRRADVAPVVFVAAAYLLSLILVCHKEARYLLSVSPLIAVLAGYGAVEFHRSLRQSSWPRRLVGARADALLSSGFALGMLAVVASLLPRNELPALASKGEDCPSFVFDSLDELARLSGERPFALVHPCQVPEVFLEDYNVAYQGLGMTPYTHERALRELRGNLPSYGAILVDAGSEVEQLLIEEYGNTFSLSHRSPAGHYVIYHQRVAQRLWPAR